MTEETGRNEPDRIGPMDEEWRRALRAATAPPMDEVDWAGLRHAIISEAERRFEAPRAPVYRTVSHWSSRGIPVAAAALLAACLVLWTLPATGSSADTAPPGFWPVAEELVRGLPDETRQILDASTDVESMIRAMVASAAEEG